MRTLLYRVEAVRGSVGNVFTVLVCVPRSQGPAAETEALIEALPIGFKIVRASVLQEVTKARGFVVA